MDDLESIPVCKKCCFCFPLRYGLLTWGYIKLGLAILGLGLFASSLPFIDYFTIPCILVLGTVMIDICLTTIFIIGGHEKSLKLLVIYYYYVLVMWVINVLLFIICTSIIMSNFSGFDFLVTIALILDAVCSVVSISAQTYFIFLLRSEIIKLRSNCPYRFVKNANDNDGTVRCEGQLYDIDKTTEAIYEQEIS